MGTKEEVLAQLDALIGRGKEIVATYRYAEASIILYSQLPEHELRAYLTSGTATVARIAGATSEYYRQLPKPPDAGSSVAGLPNVPAMVLGAVSSLRGAVASGFLTTLEQTIRANLHDDLLAQAKELSDHKYHVAAIVLAGGVLENHLQKLCVARQLKWTGDGSLSKYNDVLKSTYDQPTWRRIQSITDDRNNAAHGHGTKVKPEDVEDHVKYVLRFLTDWPS